MKNKVPELTDLEVRLLEVRVAFLEGQLKFAEDTIEQDMMEAEKYVAMRQLSEHYAKKKAK